MLIDCRSLEVDYIPINLPEIIVVCNTNVKHSLASSAYNQRRQECESAVTILREHLPAIAALRNVSPAQLEAHAADLSEKIFRPARHVVTESEKTKQAAIFLREG